MNGYEKFGKKRRQWEDSGVHELIKLWKCCAYELRTIKRNGHLYVAMAKQLSALGVPVTALEVHFKVNNLTQRYRQESKTYEATGIVSTWKFYSLVDDVFKSLGHSSAGFKQEKRIMTPAISLSSMTESSVWKSPMSQQEFTSNTEGFYKTEYSMSSRHYLEHSQTPNPSDVNFMAAASAAARMNENNIDPMNASTNEANTSAAGAGGGGSNFPDRLSKMKKPEDYDKFVDIVKNIVDHHKSTPDKADTFSDFIKSYLKRWPDRLQDEAINHITNYIIVKNMEHTISSTASGANRQ